MTSASDSNLRIRAALAWLATFAGALIFAIVHLFGYLGVLAAQAGDGHDHGHDHGGELAGLDDPNSAMSWMIAVFYLAGLVPIVAALLSGRRPAAVVALAVGALFVIGNIADGLAHGIADGSAPSLVTAVLGVGAPGALALVATWRWLRSSSPAPSPAEG